MTEDEHVHRSMFIEYDMLRQTLHADLYPSRNVVYIQIGLEHVRAADDIRISYDFERDGFKIEQSRWTDDNIGGDLWQEVAFIPSWSLDERAEE